MHGTLFVFILTCYTPCMCMNWWNSLWRQLKYYFFVLLPLWGSGQLVHRLIAIAVGCSLSGSTNGFQSFKSSFSPLMMPHHDGHHTDNVSPFLIITTKHRIVKYRFPGLLPNRGSASMSSISRRTRKDQLWYKFHSNIFSKVIFSWFYLWGVWGSDLIFSGSVMTSREIGRKSSVATVRWIYSLDASFWRWRLGTLSQDLV